MQMNEERARLLLDPEKLGGTWEFIGIGFRWNTHYTVAKHVAGSGLLTAEEAEALAWWMRNKKGE